MFTRLICCSLCVLVILCVCIAPASGDDAKSVGENPAAISAPVLNKLHQKVVEPFLAANKPLTIKGISDLLSANSPELLQRMDAHLQSEGLPRLGDLATEIWVQGIEQGTTRALPKLNWQIASQILPRIRQRIVDQLAEQRRHPLMLDAIEYPVGFAAFEDALWQTHVFERQLANSLRLCEASKKIRLRFQRNFDKQVADQKPTGSADSELDFIKLAQTVRDQQSRLAEHDAEIRYYRLENAVSVLAESTDFETRLDAAFALEYDAQSLARFFESVDEPARKNLQGDAFKENVASLVAEGRRDGGDVIRKAGLLHVALHWWIRGRYGVGPLRWGLMKLPSATQSHAAQFPLNMPVQPVAVPPSQQVSAGKSPQFERRHQYISDAEQNQFLERHRDITLKILTFH